MQFLSSSYFHLPIDEDEDGAHAESSKHISWAPADDLDSDSDGSLPSSSSSSSLHSQYGPTPPPARTNKAVINQILNENDLYRILGISRTARIDKLSLRRAYLARSKACHPDKFPNNPEATRAFQKVSLAYNVLSKPSSKRSYDSRSPNSSYDIFAARPYPPPEETFRSVVIGVFNDLLDGDLEMIRTLLRTVNDMNPALRLGEEGINSVLFTLQSIRERALTCRTCVLALHTELTRLLEVQRAFRDLSYFDLRRRSCLTIRLARLTVALPIALEQALRAQRDEEYAPDRPRDGVGPGPGDGSALLNRRVATLLRGLVIVLERMERILG
ncbi:hypothetical protein SCP_1303000 [Sparassis crispa]|uniref:J domain-containing protein n=1 Tax=Sparassis crispa TaxID=139825 RepID=A0A401H242_9APHY|nr:hypothetical protein SCP_1303000 [Sparassis crispa]GBE88484.1 hypothetical protein SCP_1303000 [Sparassis crispa]